MSMLYIHDRNEQRIVHTRHSMRRIRRARRGLAAPLAAVLLLTDYYIPKRFNLNEILTIDYILIASKIQVFPSFN